MQTENAMLLDFSKKEATSTKPLKVVGINIQVTVHFCKFSIPTFVIRLP